MISSDDSVYSIISFINKEAQIKTNFIYFKTEIQRLSEALMKPKATESIG